MHRERVVITGLGTVNALAKNTVDFARALREGVCGIGPVTLFDTTSYRTHTGAEVKDFMPRDVIPPQFSLKRMSRSDLLAFAATVEALADARLFPFPDADRDETGVVLGVGSGGKLEGEDFYQDYLRRRGYHARFSKLASICPAASADYITAHLGLRGPKTTFMTACSSAATAIGFARDLIERRDATIIIAGGVEPLCRTTYASFNALQAVAPDHCKPFDKNRRGLSLGEASAILILESLTHASERGARIYGEVLGYGVTCDAYHMTAPDVAASGATRSIRAALADAGISPDAVDYINAHGTGTPSNDVMETKALKEVFGKRAYRIPVSSTKSMTGHTLGASGALEALVSILAIRHGFIPPTINHREPDPECDLDYVTQGARQTALHVVLSNSFAFGGNNTSLLFGQYTVKRISHESSGKRISWNSLPDEQAHAEQRDTAQTERFDRQVVVSGIGMVTPLGIGKDAFAEALFRGDSGIREIAAFDASRFASHLGAEVRSFSARDFVSVKNLRKMDRLSQMVVASARMALEDARLGINPENRDRIGAILGTAFGPTDLKIHCARILFCDGPGMINPILVPNSVMNAPAGHASIELGFRGVNTTVNHQAASGETAIAYAAREIQRGAADVILAGGADILSEFFFETLVRFRAISPLDGNDENARPFDRGRNGPIAGEGCGIVCLESLEHALNRGIVPYCEIAGWGMSSAPSGPTDWPDDADGVALAVTRALQSAGLTPGDIGTIQAAANGGRNPDGIEADACLHLFGSAAASPLISSVKGALGESFSSGGIRAVALALSFQNGKVPPLLGLADPITPLRYATHEVKPMDTRSGLINAVSYGGTNVTIVMRRITAL
ncbi:MAG: beta-ketoacyl-[acyl-carrier-protein] synthase family protein [Deltaproteobacteria bacterium]|nr:beta-ketoacyl-[acyl-carrier-protein] synthase family protein [Deltaproteobacteria bacterium]